MPRRPAPPEVRALLCAALACCTGSSATARADPQERPQGGCAPAALGLTSARAVSAWRAPAGCTLRDGSATPTPTRDEAGFASRWACPAGVTSGVDWTRFAVWSMATMLSPAGAGYAVYADGARLTLVSRQRTPCPDDPRPMPTPYTLAFLLPAAQAFTVAQATCTLPPQCR